MRPGLALALLALLEVGCASESPEDLAPAPLIPSGGSCVSTQACEDGLYCAEGTCAQARSDDERRAVEAATLSRKIAETHRLEKAAYTKQGRQRMRDERAKLEAKLAALSG